MESRETPPVVPPQKTLEELPIVRRRIYNELENTTSRIRNRLQPQVSQLVAENDIVYVEKERKEGRHEEKGMLDFKNQFLYHTENYNFFKIGWSLEKTLSDCGNNSPETLSAGVTGTNSVVQLDGLAFVTTFRVHPSVPAPTLRVRQTLFGCEEHYTGKKQVITEEMGEAKTELLVRNVRPLNFDPPHWNFLLPIETDGMEEEIFFSFQRQRERSPPPPSVAGLMAIDLSFK
ncbi:hypothetical protein RUM43_014710 [Polyplax serrata]|uniref:Uncharacterized protein n=1 Tax=Polyplax serrata TaxID=468196 RepID=A0AAN8S6K9_POLSC